jgi:hypothetical protein
LHDDPKLSLAGNPGYGKFCKFPKQLNTPR